MTPEQRDYPFPVGDDPDDPSVLEYWRTVARRMEQMLLPPALRWEDAIRDRIREYESAREQLGAAQRKGDAEGAAVARKRLRWAKDEFPRLKWKLSAHFVAQLGPTNPGLVALFARPSGAAN